MVRRFLHESFLLGLFGLELADPAERSEAFFGFLRLAQNGDITQCRCSGVFFLLRTRAVCLNRIVA